MKTTVQFSYWDLAGLHTELAHSTRIEALIGAISELPIEQIVAFHRFCQEQQDKAQTDLFFIAAPYLHSTNGLCTSEHFNELTAWLVFQGKEVYSKALANPDALGHIICDLTAPKDFLHLCSAAYTEKTGHTNFEQICEQREGPLVLAKTTTLTRREAYAEPEKIRLLLPCLYTKYLVTSRLHDGRKPPIAPARWLNKRRAALVGVMFIVACILLTLCWMLVPTQIVIREVQPNNPVINMPQDNTTIDAQLFEQMEHHYAAKQIYFAQLLFQHKDRVNLARDSLGMSLLEVAAKQDYRDETLLLLTAGADPNLRDEKGQTPLFYAADCFNNVVADILILKGANVNAQDQSGNTPLTVALKAVNPQLVDHLLMRGASLHPLGLSGDSTPEALAKNNYDQNSLVQFYAHLAPPRRPETFTTADADAFTDAAFRGDVKAVREFLTQGFDPNHFDSAGQTALLRTTYKLQVNSLDIFTEILIGGADPNLPAIKSDVTPFRSMFDWSGSHSEEMRLELLAAGANTHLMGDDGNSMLGYAAQKESEHAAQWIIWMGNDPNQSTPQGTAMYQASKDGRRRMVDLLRRNGVTEKPYVSLEPAWQMATAIRGGDEPTVLELLAKGIPVDMPLDADGSNGLMISIGTGRFDIARVLIAHGANLNYQNFHGETVLHVSCCWCGGEVEPFREEILTNGANPNLPNKDGVTPFMRACQNGDLAQKITQMLAHGAEINHRDNKGKTALGYAKSSGRTDAIAYLISHGAVE